MDVAPEKLPHLRLDAGILHLCEMVTHSGSGGEAALVTEHLGADWSADTATLDAVRNMPRAATRASGDIVAARTCTWRGRGALLCYSRDGYLHLIGDGLVPEKRSAHLSRVVAERRGRRLRVTLDGGTESLAFRDEGACIAALAFIEGGESNAIGGHAAALEREDDARLVRGCSYMAGAGLALSNGYLYDVLFSSTNVHFLAAPATTQSEPLLSLDISQLRDLRLEGPGTVTSGGGFVGGGFGLSGAVEGMAIASVLNALTTSTDTRTVLILAGPGWEAFLLHKLMTPEELRLHLSPVYVRLNSLAEQAPAPNATLDQLERLVGLYQSGVLTEDEFAAAKRSLLGT